MTLANRLARCFDTLDQSAELIELAAGELRIPGAGEVRGEAAQRHRRVGLDRRQQLRRGAGRDAEPAHAGVDHQLDRRDTLLPARFSCEQPQPVVRVNAGGDAVAHHRLDLAVDDCAEDQDRAANAGLAQLDRLARVPDADHRHTRIRQGSCDGDRAVAIGVGFEHRHHVDGGSDK